MKRLGFFLTIFTLLIPCAFAQLSEFNTSNAKISLSELLSGGPSKDGIPALTNPLFVPAADALIQDDELVVGVVVDGVSKAYPFNVLTWHEIVNDRVGNMDLAITYCPLTKSAITFDRRINGEAHEFGVSGMLYNNNVVMYDRTSQALWSQLHEAAVTGPQAGMSLKQFPSEVTTWKRWLANHPNTVVLSADTGYTRDYNRNPYTRYHANNEVIFPQAEIDDRLEAKQLVIGLTLEEISKAYPLNVIAQNGVINDEVGGQKIRVEAGPNNTAVIKNENGETLPAYIVFWFAWSTFHPETEVYTTG